MCNNLYVLLIISLLICTLLSEVTTPLTDTFRYSMLLTDHWFSFGLTVLLYYYRFRQHNLHCIYNVNFVLNLLSKSHLLN